MREGQIVRQGGQHRDLIAASRWLWLPSASMAPRTVLPSTASTIGRGVPMSGSACAHSVVVAVDRFGALRGRGPIRQPCVDHGVYRCGVDIGEHPPDRCLRGRRGERQGPTAAGVHRHQEISPQTPGHPSLVVDLETPVLVRTTSPRATPAPSSGVVIFQMTPAPSGVRQFQCTIGLLMGWRQEGSMVG